MRKYARRDGKQLRVISLIFVLLAVVLAVSVFSNSAQGAELSTANFAGEKTIHVSQTGIINITLYKGEHFALQNYGKVNTGLTDVQGIAYDGTYFYVSNSTKLEKIDANGTVINTTPVPAGFDHFSGITYYDGKIYATMMNYPNKNYVALAIYDTNLNKIDFKNITNDYTTHGLTDMGVVGADVHDGYLWVFANEYHILKYTLNLTYITMYNMTDPPVAWSTNQYQGLAWYHDYIFTSYHSSRTVDVWKFTGTDFIYIQRINNQYGDQDTFYWNGTLYMLDRQDGNFIGEAYLQDLGLYNKAKSDFSDVVFTDANGNLLQFERTWYNSSEVSFLVNATSSEIKIWYGNSDYTATYTSLPAPTTTQKIDITSLVMEQNGETGTITQVTIGDYTAYELAKTTNVTTGGHLIYYYNQTITAKNYTVSVWMYLNDTANNVGAGINIKFDPSTMWRYDISIQQSAGTSEIGKFAVMWGDRTNSASPSSETNTWLFESSSLTNPIPGWYKIVAQVTGTSGTFTLYDANGNALSSTTLDISNGTGQYIALDIFRTHAAFRDFEITYPGAETGTFTSVIENLKNTSTGNGDDNNTNNNTNNTGNNTNSTGGSGWWNSDTTNKAKSFLLQYVNIAGIKVQVWVLIAMVVIVLIAVAAVKR